MEEAFRCSFCKEKFSNTIKLTQCGYSICHKCYEDLKPEVEGEFSYKCVACDLEHVLPPNGLPDNKNLMDLLKNFPKKELPENAKKLQVLMKELDAQLERVNLFDGKELIDSRCNQLEFEVNEAVQSAIGHLKEIEKKMLKKIDDYRKKCLENLSGSSSERSKQRQGLSTLIENVNKLKEKWNDYFNRIEAYQQESEIEFALNQTGVYLSAMKSMEDILRKETLGWQMLMLRVNLQFTKIWDHPGEIISIPEPKMSIQEEPSFVLASHSGFVRQVLQLPDGKVASCSYDKTIKVWSVENGKELFELLGHADWVLSLAILQNGQLASGSKDKTINIWDLEQRIIVRTLNGETNSVVSLRVLDNGNLASYSLDNSIKIWDLSSKEDQPVWTMKGHGNTYWDLPFFEYLIEDYFVTCSFDEKREEDCVLRVWKSTETNPIKSISTGSKDIGSLLVLLDGQVALGFQSGAIKIINLADETSSRTKDKAHPGGIYSFAQLSNGNLISSSWNGINCTIKMWNLFDLSLLQTIDTRHNNHIISLSISGDERFLVSGSYDKSIKIWQIIST